MAFEGNSHRDSSNRNKSETPAPVQREPESKAGGFLLSFLKSDSETIKDYVIETIVIPGIQDAISGIGGIILDSLTEAIDIVFEKQGFTGEKRKSGYTAYHKVGSKHRTSGTHRFRKEEDEDDEDDDEIRAYDNVRVKTEREAKDIIAALRDRIDSKGYATVADLFREAGDIVTWADEQRCWTKLDSASWVRSRGDRKKPWLLVLPKPKSISDLK